MESSTAELLSTKKGKPCLAIDGFQHRLHRRTKIGISWVCVKDKLQMCKGSVKTNFENEILSRTEHTCASSVAEIEVKKKLENCRKRVKEEITVPVSTIFHQEMSEIYSKDYNLVVKMPKYSNVKSTLCKDRRQILEIARNPKDEEKTEPCDPLEVAKNPKDEMKTEPCGPLEIAKNPKDEVKTEPCDPLESAKNPEDEVKTEPCDPLEIVKNPKVEVKTEPS